MKDELGRLNRLVNDFLAVGRQAPPELAPCDLRAALEQAVTLVEKQGTHQAIGITIHLPAELLLLQVDSGQMETTFLNILTNAVQAVPRGGEIRVAARVEAPGNGNPGWFRVEFADTGPGIPREDRERVFAPYYSTKATGFGLGLAITRKIVEDHGGRIYVGEGELPGAVVVVELPLTAPSVAQPVGLAKSSAA